MKHGEVKLVPIDSIRPHPDNYRRHPPEQLRRIRQSLRERGQYKPVTVQASSGWILAGHGVWQAATEEGWLRIQVEYVDCSDAEGLKIIVDDNELARFAEQDDDKLGELLAGLHAIDEYTLTWEDDEALNDLLRELTMPRMGEAPEEFPVYDESIAEGVKTATCPECGYEFPV